MEPAGLVRGPAWENGKFHLQEDFPLHETEPAG